jgi:hypothetical protein
MSQRGRIIVVSHYLPYSFTIEGLSGILSCSNGGLSPNAENFRPNLVNSKEFDSLSDDNASQDSATRVNEWNRSSFDHLVNEFQRLPPKFHFIHRFGHCHSSLYAGMKSLERDDHETIVRPIRVYN